MPPGVKGCVKLALWPLRQIPVTLHECLLEITEGHFALEDRCNQQECVN